MADDLSTTDDRATLLPIKPRTLIIAVVLLTAGVAGRKLWDGMHASLAQSPRYQITAETIRVTPEAAPPWIRTDVKTQVLRDSGIAGSLSLLDKPATIHQRLVDAFELHPWVRRVERVVLASPTRIDVELEYREPVAVAMVKAGEATEMVPVDREAVRLPGSELTDVELAYLPRITGIEDRPLVGEAWSDIRMQGAAALAAHLRNVWEQYSLVDIVPSPYPDVQRSHRFYTYDMRTSGGTIIRWGAAPGFSPPGENSFEEKLTRLSRYIQQNGPLESIDSPQALDVRDGLRVEKRTVRHGQPDEALR